MHNPLTPLIVELDKRLISSSDNSALGLANGKMGICLYFYLCSRLDNNREYQKNADRLLDEIFAGIQSVRTIDVMQGLVGIGLGVDYLIKNGYVKGNSNTVLSDLDDEIFKQLTATEFPAYMDSLNLIQLLYYLCIRLKSQKQGSDAEFLYRELIILAVNKLYEKVDDSLFEEPFCYSSNYKLPQLLYVLGIVYSLGFYNYCLRKILEEICFRLCSIIPVLHAHRLYLIWGIRNLMKEVDMPGVGDHLALLERELHVSTIFAEELRNKNICFLNGVASIYLWLQDLRDAECAKDFASYQGILLERLGSSDMWSLFESDPNYIKAYKGLLDGYCGMGLLARVILKQM